MGCFSFLCKACGKGINSSSFRGERCIMFLLKDGKVIETMQGEYDSYGRVFDGEGVPVYWSMPWADVCHLMFSSDTGDGIAAFHERCYQGLPPVTRSDDDPDQGWNEFEEPEFPFSKVPPDEPA
jgi:hypothetical protein